MITFILGRLMAAVFLLVVVSMVIFAIFFVLPKLGGQTSYGLATQYVGRNPSRAAVLQMEAQLGLDKPLYQQYWDYLRAIVAGGHYGTGAASVYCPPPCFGYSFKNQQPVWPMLVSSIPVTVSLAFGAAVLWLAGGIAIGVVSALKRGAILDRLSMTVALAGVWLPIFFTGLVSLVLFSYKWPIFPAAVDIFGRPGHPYTWGLLASMPRLDRERQRRLVPIPGTPPSLIRVPPGCPFHPRCRYTAAAGGRCQVGVPVLREAMTPGHAAACHLTAAQRARERAALSAGQAPGDAGEPGAWEPGPQGGVDT